MAEPIVVKFEADITELKNRLKELENANKKAGESGKKAGKEIEGSYASAGKSLENTFNNIGAGILAAFSITAVTNFAKASVEAFAKAEAQTNQLRFAVEKVGKMGTKVFDALIRQSKQLAAISFFDDEDIQDAQRLLVQIGLNADEIQRLTPLVLDLAAAQGTDLATAAQKAVNAINGQTRGLKDVGANFEDTGTKVGNYNKLVESLTKIQGSAADALDTTSGAMRDQAVEVENLQESLGERLAPAIVKVKTFFLQAATGLAYLLGLIDEPVDNSNVETFLSRLSNVPIEKVNSLLAGTNEQVEELKAKIDDLNKKQESDFISSPKRAKEIKDLQKQLGLLIDKQTALNLELERRNQLEKNANSLAKQDQEAALQKAKENAPKLLAEQKAAQEKQAKNEQEFKDKQLAALDSRLKDYITHLIEGLNQQNLTEKGYSVERIKIDLVELEERKKLYESYGKDVSDINRQIAESKRKLNEALEKPIDIHPNREDFEKIQKEQEEANKGILARHRQLVQDILVASGSLIQSLFDISANNRDARFTFISDQNDAILEGLDQEADALEEANKRKALSDRAYEVQKAELLKRRKAQEEDFAKQQKRIAREDAIARKTAAIFAIILNTAQGITSALAQLPPNIPLSILVGITGAAQLAVASSTPIPRLKDGTDYVELGKNKKGVDTIPALLNEGERVTKAEINKKYWNVLNSIDGGRFDEFVHKNYVLPAMIQFKKQSEANQRAELGQHIAKGIIFNTSSEDFGKAISKGVSIKNEKSLAKQIARELSDILPKERHHW